MQQMAGLSAPWEVYPEPRALFFIILRTVERRGANNYRLRGRWVYLFNLSMRTMVGQLLPTAVGLPTSRAAPSFVQRTEVLTGYRCPLVLAYLISSMRITAGVSMLRLAALLSVISGVQRMEEQAGIHNLLIAQVAGFLTCSS